MFSIYCCFLKPLQMMKFSFSNIPFSCNVSIKFKSKADDVSICTSFLSTSDKTNSKCELLVQ